MAVHPTAIVHPSVELFPDVSIGPYSIVEEDVQLSEGVRIGAFCRLYPGARLGREVELYDGVIVAGVPQDMKFGGEKTQVHIGDKTRLREFVTVHRGTRESGMTRIGRECMIMAYCHVAHDCRLGDGVILSNAVQLGGHVKLDDHVVVSGMTGISQFIHVGRGSFIGGGLRVDRDIPPWSKALGEPLRWAGVNAKGLAKDGYGASAALSLRTLYKVMYGSVTQEFLLRLQNGEGGLPPVSPEMRSEVMDFLEAPRKGLLSRNTRRQ